MPDGMLRSFGIARRRPLRRVTPFARSMTARTLRAATSMTTSWPENSQLASMRVSSAVKSAWLIPLQGMGSEYRRRMVCGLRKSSRFSRSAITRAERPSGLKYRL
jgi:hypothetical protein